MPPSGTSAAAMQYKEYVEWTYIPQITHQHSTVHSLYTSQQGTVAVTVLYIQYIHLTRHTIFSSSSSVS